jgi:predicted ribonuclease YlaK
VSKHFRRKPKLSLKEPAIVVFAVKDIAGRVAAKALSILSSEYVDDLPSQPPVS